MMRLVARGLAGLVLAGAIASCSSKSSPNEFDDPDLPGRTTNPDGIAYPTDHLGGTKHAATRPGDRIPNFTFQGYIDGDRASGLETISLADFFDPGQKRFKVLDLQVSATWCGVCSQVTSATVPVKEALKAKGALVLEVIVAGNAPSAGPDLDEVSAWMTSHQSNVTTAIDVRGHRLGAIGIDRTLVPYDILIDLRSMEILDSSAGAPRNFDIARYAQDGLDYVGSHPPAY